MRFLLLIISVIQFISCNTAEEKSKTGEPADQSAPSSADDSVYTKDSTLNHMSADSNPDVHAKEMSTTISGNITVKVFKNTDTEGFGYDIIMDDHTYIHQPNIPALPGNKGFQTEENARKIADFVVFKIKNNILPPTVEVRELDSLGVK